MRCWWLLPHTALCQGGSDEHTIMSMVDVLYVSVYGASHFFFSLSLSPLVLHTLGLVTAYQCMYFINCLSPVGGFFDRELGSLHRIKTTVDSIPDFHHLRFFNISSAIMSIYNVRSDSSDSNS